MKVYIDSNEQTTINRVIKYWESRKKDFPHIDSVTRKHLASSDICTSDGLVGGERKSSKDFISSICGGRLKKQLYELKQNFKYAFLFIEDYDSILDCMSKNPQVHPNVILGTTASALAQGVSVTYVGPFYPQLALQTIEKFCDGRVEKYASEYNPIRRAVSKKDNQLNICIGLPNVQPTRAVKLLSKFKTIQGITNASIDELKEIDGIGDKIAKGIYESVR